MANSIPATAEFPQAPNRNAFEGMYSSPSERARLDRGFELACFQAARRALQGFPRGKFPAFRRFVGRLSKKRAMKFFAKCHRMNTARELLWVVARISPEVSRDHLSKYRSLIPRSIFFNQEVRRIDGLSFGLKIKIDGKGLLQIEPHEVLEMIKG